MAVIQFGMMDPLQLPQVINRSHDSSIVHADIEGSVNRATPPHISIEENNWELFIEEANQLEYDEEELFISSFPSTPTVEQISYEDEFMIDTTINSSLENLIPNEQLLIEGLQYYSIISLF